MGVLLKLTPQNENAANLRPSIGWAVLPTPLSNKCSINNINNENNNINNNKINNINNIQHNNNNNNNKNNKNNNNNNINKINNNNSNINNIHLKNKNVYANNIKSNHDHDEIIDLPKIMSIEEIDGLLDELCKINLDINN